MTRILALLALLFADGAAIAAPPIGGLWLTQDRDGVVAVEPCGDKLCARIDGVILDHPNDPTPVDYRGASQCHLPLITDAVRTGPNSWKGHITDPRNGSVYHVELFIEPNGNLALRGYVGIPLLGETETWTRYNGRLPEDCRLTKASGAPVVTR